MAVHNKQHFIYAVHILYQLRSLERRERFSGTGCVPDIAVLVRVLHAVKDMLYGIVLIRAKDHEALVTLMQNNVFCENLTKRAFVKKLRSKTVEVTERDIGGIRPFERELISAVRIVSEITCVDRVGDYKNLNIVKQTRERCLVVALNLVVCLFQLNSGTFEFYLYERQTIDEDGHIIAALFAPFNGDLVCNLKLILTPLMRIEELDPYMLTVFRFKSELVTEFLGFLEACAAL